ncbi:hypothetical protein [Pseudonocardia thermophila]|uniref:hypothetical protein n=1 Tax=Pseudonocardia thermophila TaxID=1848 RepID=UPI001F2E02DA|nr:hypothetical protein [Pseudonocardia thermophila]
MRLPYRPRRSLPPETAEFLERLRPRDRGDLLDELRRWCSPGTRHLVSPCPLTRSPPCSGAA